MVQPGEKTGGARIQRARSGVVRRIFCKPSWAVCYAVVNCQAKFRGLSKVGRLGRWMSHTRWFRLKRPTSRSRQAAPNCDAQFFGDEYTLCKRSECVKAFGSAAFLVTFGKALRSSRWSHLRVVLRHGTGIKVHDACDMHVCPFRSDSRRLLLFSLAVCEDHEKWRRIPTRPI